jgi:presenilin-like A22 family membrane protease
MLVPHLSGERDGKANMLGLGDLAIPNKSIVKMKVLAKS